MSSFPMCSVVKQDLRLNCRLSQCLKVEDHPKLLICSVIVFSAKCQDRCNQNGICILPETCRCYDGFVGTYCESSKYSVCWLPYFFCYKRERGFSRSV